MTTVEAPSTAAELAEHYREHGRPDLSRAIAEAALADPETTGVEVLHLQHQLLQVCPVAADVYPNIAFVRIDDPSPVGWNITNPALHPTAPERRLHARIVNYRSRGKDYIVFHPDAVVMTRPALVSLNESLQTIAFANAVDETGSVEIDRFRVRGYEDVRLFSHGGQEYGIASIRNLTDEGICQQVLLTFAGTRITGMRELSTADEGHHKNWMPVIGTETMTFLDSVSPKRVRTFDPFSGDVTVTLDETGHPLARSFRGGSALVPLGDGYLAVIHEVVHYTNGERFYTHRFVRFDAALDSVACSDQFFFAKKGIEFCAGLRIEGDTVLCSLGINDATGWIARIPLTEVVASLVPLAERSKPPVHSGVITGDNVAGQRQGIVSVTLAHNGREAVLKEALASVVDHVDTCLVINTGTSEEIDRVAREVAGERAVIVHHAWTNDFAEARNASLAYAASHTNAEWALICDSDEQIRFGEREIHETLAALDPKIESLNTTDLAASYIKIRFFRLPVHGRYVGTTHEYFDVRGRQQDRLDDVTFTEAWKDEAENAHKSERDFAILQRETRRRPLDTRWWFYLGDCLAGRNEHREAILAYRQCVDLQGWNEEAAWACYKEAHSWLALNQPDRAIERCAVGMGIHPGVAELPWLASFAAFRLERYREAIFFANLAITHGEYVGLAAEANRIAFRHFQALYEGPFDMLRHAYRRLGDHVAADEAEQDFQQALAMRKARPGQG